MKRPRPTSREVVSIAEIDDYFLNRGIWNGHVYELASTPAKRMALWWLSFSRWSMRAGWIALALLSVPPLSVLLVVIISSMAGIWPTWFPGWLSEMTNSGMSGPASGAARSRLLLLLSPVACWILGLLADGRSPRYSINIDEESEITHVTFLQPLVSGGVLGNPDVLVYSAVEPSEEQPLCMPVLSIPEDLPFDRDPEERHLVGCAAQCLLVENACQTTIDVGILQYRNRVMSLLMTDFARRRTAEVIREVRNLQVHQKS